MRLERVAPRALRYFALAARMNPGTRPLKRDVRRGRGNHRCHCCPTLLAIGYSHPGIRPLRRRWRFSAPRLCAWHLLVGARDWSQSYFAVFFASTLTIGRLVYLRASLWLQWWPERSKEAHLQSLASRFVMSPSNHRFERSVKNGVARCARRDYFARTARSCRLTPAAQARR